MNSSQVISFLETVQQKSFTKAASTLHQTQPGISRHIASLEEELGAKLIERAPHKPIELTEIGKIYYQAFLQCHKAIEDARDQCNRINRDKALNLRFGYANGWSSSQFLSPILDILRDQYPFLNIELECHGPNKLLSLLEDDKLDAVLTIETPLLNNKIIKYSYICEIPRIILYSDRLIERIGHVSAPSDFKDIVFYFPGDEVPGDFINEVIAYMDEFDISPEYRIVSNVSTVLSMVENGRGVTINDSWCQHLFMSQFHAMPINSNHNVILAYRRDCAGNKVIKTIRGTLRSAFTDN